VALCFVAPFFVLLSRDVKQSIRPLAVVAVIVLLGFGASLYWTIVPAFPPLTAPQHALNLAALLAVGGFWYAFRSWQLGRILRDNYVAAATTETAI
jgi:hypothetical protein